MVRAQTNQTGAFEIREGRLDGEMAQQLGAIFTLAEDPGSIPGTHVVAHSHSLISSRGSKVLF